MKQYVNNFLKYRFLLWELVKKDIKLKYRKSYLGILWTLIEPLLTMVVLTIVFGTLFGNQNRQFPVYVLTGRLLYSFFNVSTKAAMKSIRMNSGMIKKVYVPKYIYPLSSTLSSYVTFLISLIVLIIVSIVLQVPVTKYTFLAIIPLLLVLIMSYGVGMLLATLAVFFRDLEYLWNVVLMLVMYTCAIFYPTQRLIKTGYGWILDFNPLYSIILNFRNCVLYGKPLDERALIISVVFSVAIFVIGTFAFYKKQDEFILNI